MCRHTTSSYAHAMYSACAVHVHVRGVVCCLVSVQYCRARLAPKFDIWRKPAMQEDSRRRQQSQENKHGEDLQEERERSSEQDLVNDPRLVQRISIIAKPAPHYSVHYR